MSKKKVIILVVVAILLVVLAYFLFFYKQSCHDGGCFSNAMLKCEKVSYLSDVEDAAWMYNIKGKKKGECVINVELLQAKQGDLELEKIQGLDMDCYLILGYTGSPQADLSLCHGLLKEALQEKLIEKMHAYIISNLGKIDEALKSAL